MIGNQSFPASLLDLPTVVESYKTYDDSFLVKAADIGQVKVKIYVYILLICRPHNHFKLEQMIMVREEDDPAPEGVEYKHGLTPPMRDARRRRFRREPDLNVYEIDYPSAIFVSHVDENTLLIRRLNLACTHFCRQSLFTELRRIL